MSGFEFVGRCTVAGVLLVFAYVMTADWSRLPTDNQSLLQVTVVGGLVIGTIWTGITLGRQSEARRKAANKP